MARDLFVHVIDDDDAARDSLAFLLQASGFSVCSYASASAFLDGFGNVESGCVVTDMRMPEIDGLELLRRMAGRQAAIPVIVVTGHGDVPLALEAIKAGAIDFIEKPFDDETLLGAVRSALCKRTVGAMQRTEIEEKLAALSIIERQVLQGLATGKSNNAIASDLRLSLPQVEIHRASVMTKLQAGSLSHLVRMMLRAGQSLS